MAKKINNDKGFLVIKMNAEEAKQCGFGFREGHKVLLIDDMTNEELKYPMIYIAVLNSLVNEESYEDWLEDAINYPEDRGIERAFYNKYADILDLELELFS